MEQADNYQADETHNGPGALAMNEQTLHGSLISRNEVVTCSDLKKEERKKVKEFTKSFGMEYSRLFIKETSHLVVSSKLCHGPHTTFKYLLAVSSKIYVISMLWIEESLQAKRVLPVENYIPTNCSGPSRCLMSIHPPFVGFSIFTQLMTFYPGAKVTEALCKLCGANIMDDIVSLSQNWPCPRFCLYQEETDLTGQVLNICRRNLIVAINYKWVLDCIRTYKRIPILKYLSPTFMLTQAVCNTYMIPQDLLFYF